MGRSNSFETLPPEIREAVDRLIREGRTIAEIRAHLDELQHPRSHGATGRYVQRARHNMARFREAQEIAGQWVTELGEAPRGDVGVLLAEMLKTVAFNTLDQLAGGDEEVKPAKPMDIMLLAKAIQSLESTAKASHERRERIEQNALKRQAAKAEKAAKARGLTDNDWAAIRAEFLGIPTADNA